VEPQDLHLRPQGRIAVARIQTPPAPTPAAVNASRSKRALDAALRRRERTYHMLAWTMLTCGVVALLILPTAIAAMTIALVTKLQTHFAWHGHALATAGGAFVLASAIVLPALFWLERLTRGHWFDGDAASDGAVEAVPVAGIIELLLWGPRMIFAARERWRQSAPAMVLTDAAATIAYLRHFDDAGVGTHELPTIQPAAVLRYLASRNWVGLSDDGRRVWLLRDARRALGFDAR
jgi:hypothetical protein